MKKADNVVDKAADGLRRLADRAAAEGGVAGKLAEPLAEDAAFLRQLKPSLIKARVKGQAPTDRPPGGGGAPAAPTAPRPRPRSKKKSGSGPNPFLVVGAALAVGIIVAKVIDWRGHAHPRA
jgi:hypothetical protein